MAKRSLCAEIRAAVESGEGDATTSTLLRYRFGNRTSPVVSDKEVSSGPRVPTATKNTSPLQSSSPHPHKKSKPKATPSPRNGGSRRPRQHITKPKARPSSKTPQPSPKRKPKPKPTPRRSRLRTYTSPPSLMEGSPESNEVRSQLPNVPIQTFLPLYLPNDIPIPGSWPQAIAREVSRCFTSQVNQDPRTQVLWNSVERICPDVSVLDPRELSKFFDGHRILSVSFFHDALKTEVKRLLMNAYDHMKPKPKVYLNYHYFPIVIYRAIFLELNGTLGEYSFKSRGLSRKHTHVFRNMEQYSRLDLPSYVSIPFEDDPGRESYRVEVDFEKGRTMNSFATSPSEIYTPVCVPS